MEGRCPGPLQGEAMPPQHTTSHEPGHSGFWALDISTLPGGWQQRGRWEEAGQEEPPTGCQGCGVDQHRGAQRFDFLPRAEPISSSVTCAAWGRGGRGEPGTAPSGTAWGAAPCRQVGWRNHGSAPIPVAASGTTSPAPLGATVPGPGEHLPCRRGWAPSSPSRWPRTWLVAAAASGWTKPRGGFRAHEAAAPSDALVAAGTRWPQGYRPMTGTGRPTGTCWWPGAPCPPRAGCRGGAAAP